MVISGRLLTRHDSVNAVVCNPTLLGGSSRCFVIGLTCLYNAIHFLSHSVSDTELLTDLTLDLPRFLAFPIG